MCYTCRKFRCVISLAFGGCSCIAGKLQNYYGKIDVVSSGLKQSGNGKKHIWKVNAIDKLALN